MTKMIQGLRQLLEEEGRTTPVLFFGELHVGLVLALLVFQGAVHEQDARVVNFAPHATRRHDILHGQVNLSASLLTERLHFLGTDTPSSV